MELHFKAVNMRQTLITIDAILRRMISGITRITRLRRRPRDQRTHRRELLQKLEQ